MSMHPRTGGAGQRARYGETCSDLDELRLFEPLSISTATAASPWNLGAKNRTREGRYATRRNIWWSSSRLYQPNTKKPSIGHLANSLTRSIAAYTSFGVRPCRLATTEIAARRVIFPLLVRTPNSWATSASLINRGAILLVIWPISTTTVNSPRGGSGARSTEDIGPLTNSSCAFVNSRPTVT